MRQERRKALRVVLLVMVMVAVLRRRCVLRVGGRVGRRQTLLRLAHIL